MPLEDQAAAKVIEMDEFRFARQASTFFDGGRP